MAALTSEPSPLAPFDPLTTTASQLAELLAAGTLTSVQIATAYLDQIAAHNKAGAKLNAIIATPPRENVLAKAAALDAERGAGKLRGPLHGVPVVVKDVFVFAEGMGMATTVGSVVFGEQGPGRSNADVIQQLIDQGMIIFATANLTEFCGHKAESMTPGWSAVGGQTRSAYDCEPPSEKLIASYLDAHAGGSSSGSAVAVSAGFAPLSLGTQTGGSLIYPASKAGLYAMQPTLGFVSSKGAFRISRSFDGIGGMAKTPRDLALLVKSIVLPEVNGRMFGADGEGFERVMRRSWEGVRVGIVESTWGGSDVGKWGSEAVRSRYESLVSVIREGGGFVVYPAAAPGPETIKYEGQRMKEVAFYEHNEVIQEFCAGFRDPKVHNLTDIIKFNEENAASAMPQPHPNQTELINSFNSPLTARTSDAIYNKIHRLAAKMEEFMDEIGVDLIVSSSDCSLVSFTACGGYPSGTVPLGQLENGLPYGMFVLARRYEEGKIMRFMSAFEKTMPGVQTPVLREWQ